MKKLTFIRTLAFIAVAFFAALVSAQPAAFLPMIQGEDLLRNYALSTVVSGSRHLYSPSMDWNYADSFTSTNVVGTSAEDVLDKLFAAEFKYRISNPADHIEGYVYLYDDVGNLVFYGYARYFLVDLEKGVGPQYNIWLQDISLLSNADSAEILVLGEDGSTARHIPLDVKSGKIQFPQHYAGAPNGILAVRFNDGTTTTYRLEKPSAQNPGLTTEGDVPLWSVDGHYRIVSSGGGIPLKVKIVALYTRPTVTLTVKAGDVVEFDVTGYVQDNGREYFERPWGLFLPEVITPILLNEDGPTTITFPTSGTFRLRFAWDQFGKPHTIYSGPSGGGGGGEKA